MNWIKCTEKLPNKDGDYLVVKSIMGFYNKVDVELAEAFEKQKGEKPTGVYFVERKMESCYIYKRKIKANWNI